MPPGKKRRKLRAKKTTSTKAPPDAKKKHLQESLFDTKSWIKNVQNVKMSDYEHNGEIMEINSDEDSDDFECNLKELEKPLKKLLRKRPDSLIRKRVNLECEWGKCSFETVDAKAYNNHVHDHLVPLVNTGLKCLWNLCKFETEDRTELLRHIDYHAYHTRLKTFGLGLVDVITIPSCHRFSRFRNEIPSIPSDYFCYWNGCSISYNKFNDFIEHVNSHLVLDYQKGSAAIRNGREHLSNVKVTCRWDGCQKLMPHVFQLKRHMKTHTNEKLIACANCGTCFINKPLFIDHCMRQVAAFQRSFQCPDCFKSYPSEKLLKDHRRSHVNKFQCNLCGLSWQKQSVLARHVLYRHMTDKPFSCDDCDYKAKTKRDLEAHYNTHKTGDNDRFKCEIFQCDYSSKTLNALKSHDAREHLGQVPAYQCHCCDKTYKRGYSLSKHLKQNHSFKLARGQSRFIYKQEIDGFYRLQTKRVENLKGQPQPIRPASEHSNMDVSYEIDKIFKTEDKATAINVEVKRILRPKRRELLAEDSTEDSKDINDFAIVKKYKKIIKKIKLEVN